MGHYRRHKPHIQLLNMDLKMKAVPTFLFYSFQRCTRPTALNLFLPFSYLLFFSILFQRCAIEPSFSPILTLSLSNSSFHSNILEAHKAHTHCSINDLLFPDFISEAHKAHQQNFYLPSIHSTIFWRCTRHHFLTSFLRRTRRTHKTPSEALFILHYLRGTQGTHSLPNT